MKQAWIRSPKFDLMWVIAPLILPVIVLLILPSVFQRETSGLDTISWVILILLIDVAHVYSTLFRTYLNPRAGQKLGYKLYAIPFIAWLAGVVLFSIQPLYFWRFLAYVAVFHFIRQQYGFMRIYSRKSEEKQIGRIINAVTIYGSTILPILIWHFNGPRNFNWFVEGDFFYLQSPMAVIYCKVLFFTIVLLYVIKETISYIRYRQFYLPRFLLITGTAASWYTGIVTFNGDLAFTALNVIAHGIPYLALVWHTEQKTDQTNNGVMQFVFAKYGWTLFLAIVFIFAFIEEGLWDSLVWREHTSIFRTFYILPEIQHKQFLAFIVPLLALPQVVHYIIDGFIWKVRDVKKGQLGIADV